MINKVILVGNVGNDPEVRYFDNDSAVANFSLATTERGFTTRDGKEIPEKTEWHRIVVWRGLAKVVESYVKKGTQLYIEGKLRTRSYEDANGVTKYTTEIYADDIKLLGRRPDSSTSPQPDYQSKSSDTSSPQSNEPQQGGLTPSADDINDDLPF